MSSPTNRTLHPTLATPAIDEIVLAAQSGDAGAFATLYDGHVARIYALCLGMSGDQATAAELVQDSFVRAWEGLRQFRGDCSFATWLHRVAVNVVLESDRSRRRRSLRVAIEADLHAPADQTPADHREDGRHGSMADGAASTSDMATRIDLEQAIARLPAGARAVFVLHDISGYAHAEVAEQLGIAEGTSKAHLFRARRLLRAMLDR